MSFVSGDGLTASSSGLAKASAAKKRGKKNKGRRLGTKDGAGKAADSSAGAAPVTRSDLTFGAFTGGAPYDGNVKAVDALESRLNRRIGIVNWYQNWGGGDWISSVQPHLLSAVSDSGRTATMTWEPWEPTGNPNQAKYRLANIAGGAFDDYIASFARQLRDNGTEIYLRPMHEMNGDWYPWGGTANGNSPDQYVVAWRRMVDIFRREGATNVRFVWSPMTESTPNTKANQLEVYYPGTDYVDVLALDGYNWGSNRPDMGGYRSFAEIFKGPYKRLQALGPQPIWLAEVGTAPEGGDKAKWIRDMWATAAGWKQLKAIVWFDEDKEEDWRAAPTDAVAAAFSAR